MLIERNALWIASAALLIALPGEIARAQNDAPAVGYSTCDSCLPQRRYGSYEPEADRPPPPAPPAFVPWGYYGGYPGGFAGYPSFSYGYGHGGYGYGGYGGYYGNWGGYYGSQSAGPWGGYNAPPEAVDPGYSPGASRWYYGQSWYLPPRGYYW